MFGTVQQGSPLRLNQPVVHAPTPIPKRHRSRNTGGSALSMGIPVKSFNQRYDFISELGSGSFGSVTLARIKPGYLKEIRAQMKLLPNTLVEEIPEPNRNSIDFVAVKTMTQRLEKLSDYTKVKEIRFIYSVKPHPALVHVYEVFIDKESLRLNIVMESLDQNLYQLMKSRKSCVFSSVTLKSILSQLLAAIRHIHKSLYYHRDVKPENVLVMHRDNYYKSRDLIPPQRKKDNYIVKLADYGLARKVGSKRPYTSYVSTRWYRSPEILLRQHHYSYPIDIWAFGCVAVEAATFSPLFPGENELDQTWKILQTLGSPNSQYSNPHPFGGVWKEADFLAANLGFHLPDVPGMNIESLILRGDIPHEERELLCAMVKSCLVWDPKKRITVDELCAFPYFNGTIIREEDKSAERRDYNHAQDIGYQSTASLSSNKMNISHSNNSNLSSTFMDQSLMFAGISNGNNHSKNYIGVSSPIKDSLDFSLNQNILSSDNEPENVLPSEPNYIHNDSSRTDHFNFHKENNNQQQQQHHSLKKMPSFTPSILKYFKLGNAEYDELNTKPPPDKREETESKSQIKHIVEYGVQKANEKHSDSSSSQDKKITERIDQILSEDHDVFSYHNYLENEQGLYSKSNGNYDLEHDLAYNLEFDGNFDPRTDYDIPANYLNVVNSDFKNPESSFDSQIRIMDGLDDENSELQRMGLEALSDKINEDFSKTVPSHNWGSPNPRKYTKYLSSSLDEPL